MEDNTFFRCEPVGQMPADEQSQRKSPVKRSRSSLKASQVCREHLKQRCSECFQNSSSSWNSHVESADNSAGLSPVKKVAGGADLNFSIGNYESSWGKLGIHTFAEEDSQNGVMNFSKQGESLPDESFKSASKVSDLEFQQNVSSNQIFWSFEDVASHDESVGDYFKKNSEQLTDVGNLGMPEPMKLEDKPEAIDKMKQTFSLKNDGDGLSVFDVSASDNTQEVYQKVKAKLFSKQNTSLVEKNSSSGTFVKHKNIFKVPELKQSDGDLKVVNIVQNEPGSIDAKVRSVGKSFINPNLSLVITNEIQSTSSVLGDVYKQMKFNMSKTNFVSLSGTQNKIINKFIPSQNSTTIDSVFSEKVCDTKSQSSGIGTATSSLNNSKKVISLNDSFTIGPNQLNLKLGCYTTNRINYLKYWNHLAVNVNLIFKCQADADTLNNFYLKLPSNVTVCAFSSGIIDEIEITPLNIGPFILNIEIYPDLQLPLPFEPIVIRCHIVSENVMFQRKFSRSKAINFNFFDNQEEEDEDVTEQVEFVVANKHLTGEIPLKFNLNGSEQISFRQMENAKGSCIIRVRCINCKTLSLITKSQFFFKIPFEISKRKSFSQSVLSVFIDSEKFPHWLGDFNIQAIFWPKNNLSQQCLAILKSILLVRTNEWSKVQFYNKSNEYAISVKFYFAKKVEKSLKKLSDNNFKVSNPIVVMAPLEKYFINVIVSEKVDDLVLVASYSGGVGNKFHATIPVDVL